jgi:hypothetical protein
MVKEDSWMSGLTWRRCKRRLVNDTGFSQRLIHGLSACYVKSCEAFITIINFGHPVPDDMAGADLLRFEVPEEITEAIAKYRLGREVFEYQFETFDEFPDIPMSSAWLLTFFGNKRFAGWVWKTTDGGEAVLNERHD